MSEAKPLITRRQAGEEIAVPVEEPWDSICKVLRIARLLTCPGAEQYREYRLAMLSERLCDLEGLEFHYRFHPYSINLAEQIVPTKPDIS